MIRIALACVAYLFTAYPTADSHSTETPISSDVIDDVNAIMQKTLPLSKQCEATADCKTVTLYCVTEADHPEATLIAIIDRKPPLMGGNPALTIVNMAAAHGFVIQPDPPRFFIAEKILGLGQFSPMETTPQVVAAFAAEAKLIRACTERMSLVPTQAPVSVSKGNHAI